MFKMKLKKISEYEWEIPKKKEMNVPGKIFASEKLIQAISKDKTLEQVKNVAKLPGIIKASFAMPDAHQGYGFSIGGVAAFDLKNGIVSPGGVGYDINCGVRIISTTISLKEFAKKRKEFLHDLKRTIPSGVGRGHREKISKQDVIEVMELGSEWALKKGFATKQDIEHTEEYGKIKNANPKDVSERAIARGTPQLGTLGAGNHFIEIQKVDEIFQEKIAKEFGINKENILIMVHCGSRGLGHQVASDYIKKMEQKYGIEKFPDRELVHAPIKSELGEKYLSAMNCAVNFAFCNRQLIMHQIRGVIKTHFPKAKANLIYDVAHNIAKFENHKINGKNKKVCIHRKGATRSFGPGNKALPQKYKKTGQPVIIPGSMGTTSHILVGTNKAEELSFGSTAHGAGRIHSRTWANKKFKSEDIEKELSKKDIIIEAGSKKGLVEEAPGVYKDIEEVVKTSHELGLAKKVARLIPLAVMKG